MMIPEHVRIYIDTLLFEYERLQKRGYTSLLNIQERIEELKALKEKLEKGETPFPESKDKDENMMNMMGIINNYADNLPFNSYIRVFGTTKGISGVETALRKIRPGTKLSQEAKLFNVFMQKAPRYSFVDEGGCLSVSFKLIKTEKDFKKLITNSGAKELTAYQGAFSYLRVAVKRVSESQQYRQKGLIREYKRISARISHGNLNGTIKDFNIWHQVFSKAIYYVYVPIS